MDLQKCLKCNKYKKKDCYHENLRNTGGYTYSCKECVKLYNQKYYQENLSERRNYLETNRERIRNNKRESLSSTDRLRNNIHRRIVHALHSNGETKSKRTKDIIGISVPLFKEYIESMLEPWMSWENYGKYNGKLNYGWDIDHIMPISTAKNKDEIIKLSHYTNLQPLCSYTNRVLKRDKIDYFKNKCKKICK